MKTVGVITVLFALILLISQRGWFENVPVENIAQSDSIFWVDDIHKYAADNNLIFSGVRADEVDSNLSFYTLGTYSRYSEAEIFDEPYIAIKENKRYKVIKLDTTNIGLSSAISVIGTTTLGNSKVLELVSTYQTAWSMTSPIEGIYHECYKTLILINVEKNEVIFSKVFKRHYEDTHFYDNFDIDSLSQGLYPEDIFEKDTVEKVSTFEWFNYYYKLNDNRIEFYTINEDPTSDCHLYTPEQEKEIIAKYVTGKKPEFYYTYDSKNKKWVKKIPTH